MSDKVQITILEDGPIKISHARSATFDGQPLELDGDLWLCRCGQTRNPPFCDSTHRAVGFDGSCETDTQKPIHTWEGRTVRTHFNATTCMHVFKCQPLKALRAAELAGDDEAATEILRVVATCPSGALTAERKTPGELPPEPTFDAEIDIQAGGEIRVQCDFDINAEKLERQRPERATLCRCGLSKNKPWCDGRHQMREDFR